MKGLTLSRETKRIALGTANLNQEYGSKGRFTSLSVREAERIIELILTQDDCSIETSSEYGNAEILLGEMIKSVQFGRITTKISPKNLVKAALIKASAYKSLENLGQDKIESILLHGGIETFNRHKTEIEAGLTQLIDEGVVSRVGLSAYNEDEIKQAKNLFPFMKKFQILENIADQRVLHSVLLENLSSSDNFLQVRSIFLQGKLLFNEEEAKALFPELISIVTRIGELSKQYGKSRSEICLEYAKRILWADELVVGVDSHQNFMEILKFVRVSPNHEIDFGQGLNPAIIDPRLWSRG